MTQDQAQVRNQEENKNGLIEKIWPWAALVIIVAAAGAYYYFYGQKPVLTLEQAKIKATEFINKNLLQGGTTASIGQVTEESGLYKISLKVSDQEFTSFMTRDGKKFFTSAIDIEAIEKQKNAQSQTPETPKSEKPKVDLFVMSYCPYGTQAEKAILPVVSLLKDKINFELKFVDYLMHGQQELDENLRQYCVQKQEPQKLNDYLSCFLKEGKVSDCLAAVKIDAAKLAVCEKSADAEFSLKKSFQDRAAWTNPNYPPFAIFSADNQKYGVSGSPTLVINETKVAAARNPEALKQLICASFSERPQECQTVLSAETPSAGFGEGGSTGASGNCGQ